MTWVLKSFPNVSLLVCTVLLLGCPPDSPKTDTTPPGFVQVTASLEAPTPPVRGTFDITTTDFKREHLANLVIRINAVAGDQESGIATLTPVGELDWQCAGGQTVGIHKAPLDFTPPVASSAPSTPKSINVVVDPIAMTLKECRNDKPGWGPANISGYVRVTATNGMSPPLSVTSKTFVFYYDDVKGIQ